MIKAVIFDMDGVLIDSEPFWRKAEAEIYHNLGLPITENMCTETMGVRIDHAVEYWYKRFPWKYPSKKDIEMKIVYRVGGLIKQKGKIKEGVSETLEFLKKRNIKIGLASSSPLSLIKIVINKLKLHTRFCIVHSSEFEIKPKPDPSVFLVTAKKLGIVPENCLVIEDSPPGIIAAKKAEMKCLAITDHDLKNESYNLADYRLRSLLEFKTKAWSKLNGGN